MNPFEYIDEMKEVLKQEVKTKNIKGGDYITQAEHYKRMFGMLDILKEELAQAEYNYQIKTVNGKVKTFEEHVVLEKKLNDEVLVFQPVGTDEEIRTIDMQSLADCLRTLQEKDLIKETMILVPPNVNIFRAVLANNNITDDEDWAEEYEEEQSDTLMKFY
jgi:hypothetical protein